MRYLILSFFLLLHVACLNANQIEVIPEGPIHEAFITQESGNTILFVVPDQPPLPLTEQPPRFDDSQMQWIPGYWAWFHERGDFVWVSGVWRRPPPGQQWIPGRWRNYPTGWVWIKGFWSPVAESALKPITEIPPDPLNETIPPPPASSGSYMWIHGNWEWIADKEEFRWFSGRWEQVRQNVYYTPPQYYCRENGFLFAPGYWDYRLEERGRAYAALRVPPEMREIVVVEPSSLLHPLWMMEMLFPNWPNFATLFQTHFLLHSDMWMQWGAVPPWWHWATWWSLPPQDAWWVWWWWTHSGYPNPPWINTSLARLMPPPSGQVLKIMRGIKPPLMVTTKGVIGEQQLAEALETVTGRKIPILTSDPKQIEQIQQVASSQGMQPPPYLQPQGNERKGEIPPKPQTNSSYLELKLAPGRVKLPPPAKVFQQVSYVSPYGGSYWNDPGPYIQGHEPLDTYTPSDMQTYHLDDIETQPQPLRNPPEPKVNPYPGQETTIPNY